MGSSFGKSSPSRLESFINRQIFLPPNYPKKLFGSLDTFRSELVSYHTPCGMKISAVVVKPELNEYPEKYIIFSHGNGTTILDMFPYFKRLANTLNVGVVGYDYIGYGLSEDLEPTEERCYMSMEATIKYVVDKLEITVDKIYLVGQSLGTGVVVDYASKHHWTNPLILISPYKSICKVVLDSCCVAPIDKFQNLNKVQKITCPIKIFHGKDDKLINISHAIYLYRKLRNKSLKPVWFNKTGHNDILGEILPEHYREVLDYNQKPIITRELGIMPPL